MLSICGEIILCDVSIFSEAGVFLNLCDVSSFFFFFNFIYGSLIILFIGTISIFF